MEYWLTHDINRSEMFCTGCGSKLNLYTYTTLYGIDRVKGSEAEIPTKVHVKIVILTVIIVWIVVMLLGTPISHLARIHRVSPIVSIIVTHVFRVTT